MGKLGWTEYEYYTCSPYMFLAACEGYFDKMNERSALIRLQTLIIAQAQGAKRKGGTELKATDLWLLRDEQGTSIDKFVWPEKEEALKLREQIQKSHGIKLG